MSKINVISFPYEPMIACHINFLNDEILTICTMSNVGSTYTGEVLFVSVFRINIIFIMVPSQTYSLPQNFCNKRYIFFDE